VRGKHVYLVQWTRAYGFRYLDMDRIYRAPSLHILIVLYDTTNFVFTGPVTYHSFAHVSRCVLDVPVSVVGQMDGECSEAGWVNVQRTVAKL
jgi:hypothetical protein